MRVRFEAVPVRQRVSIPPEGMPRGLAAPGELHHVPLFPTTVVYRCYGRPDFVRQAGRNRSVTAVGSAGMPSWPWLLVARGGFACPAPRFCAPGWQEQKCRRSGVCRDALLAMVAGGAWWLRSHCACLGATVAGPDLSCGRPRALRRMMLTRVRTVATRGVLGLPLPRPRRRM